MTRPAVSVVMSVYNGRAFLREAIESILSQTFHDFEFLIIDDGSTDETPEILAKYETQDGRIRVHRHENKGRADSLNVGIGLAQGKYIARMDADDVALPHRLEEQTDFMERHPEVGLLGGAVELITGEGEKLGSAQPPLQDAAIRELMLEYNPMWHPTVVVRKEVAVTAGGYRKVLLDADDYDLWLRMNELAQLANLPKTLLQYRIHLNQVSVQNMRHQTLCVLAARAAALARKQGKTDPLSGVGEITPEFVESLGVTTKEIERAVLRVYEYWMGLFDGREPKAALRVTEEFLRSCVTQEVGRAFTANVWLTAARLQYQLGKPARALLSAGHAVLVRPIVAGRPVKRAFRYVVGAFKGGRR